MKVEVRRAHQAFARGDFRQATIASASPLTWSDPNGTGSVATTNYYLVRAFNCSSATAADSNGVGEFEFELVEGA